MSEYIVTAEILTPEIRNILSKFEIIRCRDCKHYRDHEWIIATDVSDVCHFWHGKPTKVDPDGFCAWGERRDT